MGKVKNSKVLLVAICVMMAAMLVLTGCGNSSPGASADASAAGATGGEATQNTAAGGDKTITIGSKDYTESMLCGEIMAQLLERNLGFKVTRKLNLGATNIVFEAMKKGDIELYPEFTSTALFSLFKMDRIDDLEECLKTVRGKFNNEYQMNLLEPYGFKNNFGTAISKKLADEKGITKTSQLEPIANTLVYGADHDFFERPDGYEGFKDAYNLNFKDAKKVQISLKFTAAGQGDIDVVEVYTTDAQIIQEDLVVLEDDKNYFPVYYCCPLIRNDVEAKYPGVSAELNKLAGTFDDDTMRALNAKVDVDGQKLADVATQFLKDKGLIK